MGDHLPAGKLSGHVTSHPGQLSLAIPPWVGALVLINVVTLRWAQLVPRWVTVFGQKNYLSM